MLVLTASALDGMSTKLVPLTVEPNIHCSQELEKLKEDVWKGGGLAGPAATPRQ